MTNTWKSFASEVSLSQDVGKYSLKTAAHDTGGRICCRKKNRRYFVEDESLKAHAFYLERLGDDMALQQ